MARKGLLTWKRVRETLGFFTTLLGLSSFVVAFKYFQPQSLIDVRLHMPVAVTDFSAFAKKEPEVTRQILPCVLASIPRTLLGQEYSVQVGSVTPTLMNPPLLLQGSEWVFAYGLATSSPTFQPIYSTAPFSGVSESTAVIPAAENPFSQEAMLKQAVYSAGYGSEDSEQRRPAHSVETVLDEPPKLRQVLKQRYDVEMLTATLPKRALYLIEDIFPTCIDAVKEIIPRRAAYYALADSREIWNSVELANSSDTPIQNVLVTIDRPWQGRTELVKENLSPEGATILHQGTFFSVVRFEAILEHSSKVIFLKTRGRPLDKKSVHVAHARVYSPSGALMAWLLVAC